MNSEQINKTSRPLYSFEFRVEGLLSDFVFLDLFDGNGQRISRNHSYISEVLPKGLYQINIQLGEKFETKFIRLIEDYTELWTNNEFYSALPNVKQADYYTDMSKMWSLKSTDDDSVMTQGDSSLFVFFRYPNQYVRENLGEVADSMGWRFSLLDADRNLYCKFDGQFIKENKTIGWLALHLKLPPGIYFLVYNGPKKREFPLYVFEGWQTQFFLTFKRVPIFRSARIQLVKQVRSSDITDEDSMELDMLLRNMENGVYYVPSSLISKVAYSKWENPILALAVCYAYLLSPQRNDDDLFGIMLRNIENRILFGQDFSDIKALKVLKAIHSENEFRHVRINYPCMFNIGMRTLIEQSILNPYKISFDSVCQEIISVMLNDCSWTSYLPLGYGPLKFPNNESFFPPVNDYLFKLIDPYYSKKVDFERVEFPKDWLSMSIIQQFSSTVRFYSTEELALQFFVSRKMVKNSLNHIRLYFFNLNNSDKIKEFKDNGLNIDNVMENIILIHNN